MANIESQFIVADLNNACTGVTAQNITSAMGNMIPQGVSEADRNTLNAMVQQIAAQNPNFDMNRFWNLYNQQRNWTKSIINFLYPCPNSYKFRENAKEIFDA